MIADILADSGPIPVWLWVFVVFLLLVCAAGVVASVVLVAPDASLALRQRSHERAEARALIAAQEEATQLNELWDEVEREYRRVHYRHNIHCHTCGRFSRQAVGWPEGMADCGLHGITARTSERTGAVEIIITAPSAISLLAIPELEPLDEIQVNDEEILALAAQEGAVL